MLGLEVGAGSATTNEGSNAANAVKATGTKEESIIHQRGGRRGTFFVSKDLDPLHEVDPLVYMGLRLDALLIILEFNIGVRGLIRVLMKTMKRRSGSKR